MKRKSDLFKMLTCITLVTMTITIATQSLCFAYASSPPGFEIMTDFSEAMNTEIGDRTCTLLEEKGLELNRENVVNTTVLGGEITLVPLVSVGPNKMMISKGSSLKSQFLAYINHEMLGRYLVFLDIMKSQSNEITFIKIVFPSGKGLALNMSPFCIYQIDTMQEEISLQDNDDLENTIIISDTCNVLRIITIALAAACLISKDLITCGIAAVMEAITELIC